MDQVLFSQLGSDSWLVNFKKWEQSGEPLSLFWSTLCSLPLKRSLFILNPVCAVEYPPIATLEVFNGVILHSLIRFDIMIKHLFCGNFNMVHDVTE